MIIMSYGFSNIPYICSREIVIFTSDFCAMFTVLLTAHAQGEAMMIGLMSLHLQFNTILGSDESVANLHSNHYR